MRRRRRGCVIGRLSTVNLCEDELYYLSVLLINVRCPMSFEYLLTVDGETCTTYRESAYKMDFLHQDDDVEKSMEEASIHQMAPELWRLFATLLFYCKPADIITRFV
ncbi:hypothetical protein LIER_34828 [Lithospermum erythrorhizon]|uniref:Uncharacterized protein n=1 Tax=Lithospermum erythrorhizon TaxID=34254 RepID=A0AAV3S2V9_LITER